MSASAEGGAQRRIYQKKYLLEAVKRVAPSSPPNKYAGDLSPVRSSATIVSNAVPATDYAKSTFGTLKAGVHQNAKRCNELKALIEYQAKLSCQPPTIPLSPPADEKPANAETQIIPYAGSYGQRKRRTMPDAKRKKGKCQKSFEQKIPRITTTWLTRCRGRANTNCGSWGEGR